MSERRAVILFLILTGSLWFLVGALLVGPGTCSNQDNVNYYVIGTMFGLLVGLWLSGRDEQ